jgi:hypothetical protein
MMSLWRHLPICQESSRTVTLCPIHSITTQTSQTRQKYSFSYIIYSPIFMIKLYFCLVCEVWVVIEWMGHNVTVLELSWQIGKWRHNDIISYVIKDCHSGHFVAKKKEIGQEIKTLIREQLHCVPFIQSQLRLHKQDKNTALSWKLVSK